MYIQSGGVKLSVLSKTGRETVVAMLGPVSSSARGVHATIEHLTYHRNVK